MTTLLLRKSLLTSSVASRTDLCQREAISPSLAKRPMARSQRLVEGEGRFYDICPFTDDLVGE